MEVPKIRNDRTTQIKLFKEELRKRPIAGDVYTQATNIEDERNGIIDAGTGELKVPAGILASKPPQKATTNALPEEETAETSHT